ncbi:MAG: S41 family peptidase [Pseudomonadota bacterium]
MNGQFNHSESDHLIAGWQVLAQDLTVELDHSVTEDGGHALKISSSGSDGTALVQQVIELGDAGFGGATLRGRIRTRNVVPSATLVAMLDGAEGSLFIDDMSDRVVLGDTDWQEYTLYIPASTQAIRLTVGALMIGQGAAWFDDLALVAEPSLALVSDGLHPYLREALVLMQAHYLLTDRVDWRQVEASAAETHAQAAMPQLHASASMMLDALDDAHTQFMRPMATTAAGRDSDPAVVPVEVNQLSDSLVLIRVPPVPGSASELALTEFVNQAHEQLKAVDSPALCGWIIDLRDNTGGTMWPMLAAVGMIAGPGEVGGFIGSDGVLRTRWQYRDGQALVQTEDGPLIRSEATIDPFQPRNPGLPTAVLISETTASSGEALAIAFIGRPNTRLFGESTARLATANGAFSLPDQARLVFPVAYMADRTGTVHYPDVQPDEHTASDQASDAAQRWLKRRTSCGT